MKAPALGSARGVILLSVTMLCRVVSGFQGLSIGDRKSLVVQKPYNLRHILFERPLIGIYVIKYQIIAHFRVWLGAYLRGRLFNNLVSGVGALSMLGTYSRGALDRSITVV